MTDKPDEVAELVEVGPINRIPGTDSISCPGLPSGMMCLGWGEQGWAINDKDGKRIAAGNWGECATLPASQSEALVEELRLIAVWHTPGAKTPAQPMPDVAKVCQMAANALSVSRNCDGISDAREAAAEAKGKREGIEEAAKVAEASPYNNGLNDAPSAIATAIRARPDRRNLESHRRPS